MSLLWTYLAGHPWVWLFIAVALAVWIAAVWVVVKSSKFLRKGLWILLTLASFSFSWSIAPATTVGVGIPVGALYVLWFWRFGRPPTAEQRTRQTERRANGRAPTAISSKVLVARGAYWAATVATLVMAGLIVFGGIQHIMVSDMGVPLSELPPEFMLMIRYVDTPLLAILGAVFVFLSFRPYWWGKLLLVWAGIAWTGFGAGLSAWKGLDGSLALVLAAGVTMLAAATAHQVADPRFSGSYLRRVAA
jgi:hypothetical protein